MNWVPLTPTGERFFFEELNGIDASTIKEWFKKSPRLDRVRRLDAYLSYLDLVSGCGIDQLLNEAKFGPYLSYLRSLEADGYLGKFGGTIAPECFILNYPSAQISLFWIPKNACTSAKRYLASFESQNFTQKLSQHRYHESSQQVFGASAKDVINHNYLNKLAIVRDPRERLVSCYVDKFARPAMLGLGFEPFILAHIKHYLSLNSINRDPELSMSMREFVYYISSAPLFLHDAHWLCQSAFLPKDVSDFLLLPCERIHLLPVLMDLDPDERPVGRHNATSCPLAPNGDEAATGDASKFCDMLPVGLDERIFINYKTLLDDTIESWIRRMYRADFALYKKSLQASRRMISF